MLPLLSPLLVLLPLLLLFEEFPPFVDEPSLLPELLPEEPPVVPDSPFEEPPELPEPLSVLPESSPPSESPEPPS